MIDLLATYKICVRLIYFNVCSTYFNAMTVKISSVHIHSIVLYYFLMQISSLLLLSLKSFSVIETRKDSIKGSLFVERRNDFFSESDILGVLGGIKKVGKNFSVEKLRDFCRYRVSTFEFCLNPLFV